MKRKRDLLVVLSFTAVTFLFALTLSGANVEVNTAGTGKVQIGTSILSGSNASVTENLPTGESWKTNYTPDTNRLDFKISSGQPNLLFPSLGITPVAGQNFWVVLDEKGRPTQIGLPLPNPDGLIVYFPNGSYLSLLGGLELRIKYLADGTMQVYFLYINEKSDKQIPYTDAKGKVSIFRCGETLNIAGYQGLPNWKLTMPVEKGAASPPVMP